MSSERSTIKVAVVGAHLTGQPLNYQLKERSAKLVSSTRTAPLYKFYALPGTVPPKPGLLHQGENEKGFSIEVEVWEMSIDSFGSFVGLIPKPLTIGTIILENGEEVKGFLCESYATLEAKEISHLGGWRAYLESC